MKKEECNHDWGYKTIGGFIGHEHEHIVGGLVCLDCGISLEEYIQSKAKPIGVSEWREMGKRFGYWEYFEKEIRENERGNILSKISLACRSDYEIAEMEE